MTTNTLAAIRERAAAYRKAWFDFAGLNHFDPRFEQARHVLDVERVSAPADRAALLAIVDELTARAEAAEAALEAERGLNAAYKTVIDEYAQYVDELTASKRYPVPFRDFMEWRMGEIKKQAADALAAHDANGESAGNGGA